MLVDIGPVIACDARAGRSCGAPASEEYPWDGSRFSRDAVGRGDLDLDLLNWKELFRLDGISIRSFGFLQLEEGEIDMRKRPAALHCASARLVSH